jgi:hypothetical protein
MDRRQFLTAASATLFVGNAFAMPPIQKYKWVLKAEDSGLLPRDDGVGFEFKGRLWLNSGFTPGGAAIRDFAVSNDGVKWSVINGATPYRGYANICPFGDHIYVYDGIMRRTVNGTEFEVLETRNNPPFETQAPMFELGGKLNIIRTGYVDTFDTVTRTFSTTSAPFTSTKGHVGGCFKGQIFMVCGSEPVPATPPETGYPEITSLNTVWSTSEPWNNASWSMAYAPFTPRMWPGVGVHDDHLYVTGGYDNIVGGEHSLTNRNDTFRSKDGVSWQRVETVADYVARHAPTLYSRNGRLLMVCGNTNMNGKVQKDVWELVPV